MGLAKYHAKRNFSKTPEPKGKARKSKRKGLLYVIQKHAASRMHYDFRLEHDGVLLSWAVPKGPSFDTHDKRLAVHVEDHPIEYGDFEGIIPRGEYGGGSVMLWDRGTWEPLGDIDAMYREGKLKFLVHGEKLKGSWTLVRMGGRAGEQGKNWLLIKERDEHVRPIAELDVVEDEPDSVVTGRTMAQIAADQDTVWHSGKTVDAKTIEKKKVAPPKRTKAAKTVDASGLTGAVKKAMPSFIPPQLATLSEDVPEGDAWLYELKLDGYRMLSFVDDKETRVVTRKANDWTSKFATVARAASGVAGPAVLDGEVCIVRNDGTTDFQALQNALSEGRMENLVYYVFDMPWCAGYDLTKTPLHERKELLREVLAAAPELGTTLVYGEHIEGRGNDVFEHACQMGMEGIIAKRRDSPYLGKRTGSWLKIKCHLRQELVVGGYSEPAGTRVGFGALLLGHYDDGKLIYAGRTGTGFDERTLEALYKRMKKLERDEPAFVNPPTGAEARGVHWLTPSLVAEVQFSEWTREGTIRQSVFQGLREDKPADEVKRERAEVRQGSKRAKNEGRSPKAESRSAKADSRSPKADGRKPMADDRIPKASRKDEKPVTVAGIRVTHPSRIVYPELDITKRQLVEYYDAVADRMLPYVAHRPLSLLRCPDGAGSACFFQKHLGAHKNEPGLHGIEVKDKENKGLYVLIKDRVGLLMLVQLGAMEFHPWASRDDELEHPEFMVFDLDPGEGVVWDRILEAALVLRARLEEVGLDSYVRTSGGKGLHVCVPLARKNDWDEVKAFSQAVTLDLERREPRKYISVMTKRDRTGKIFVDYLRNGRGATAVATYSTRARASAGIAMPLDWRELDKITGGDMFTLPEIAARLRKPDPWADFFDTKQAITKAMVKALAP
ncbi:MAG: DNA ligase D [Myxococcota bacterium]